MGKKKAKPVRPRPKQEEKPNLFESIYNRKKFNVLGKKQKGERKHAKARSDAANKVRDCFAAYTLQKMPLKVAYLTWFVLQRNRTLLVEYKQLNKSNAFIDRRFGGENGNCNLCKTVCSTFGLGKPQATSSFCWITLYACSCTEDDQSLTEEEKALIRFQKQRMKELGGDL